MSDTWMAIWTVVILDDRRLCSIRTLARNIKPDISGTHVPVGTFSVFNLFRDITLIVFGRNEVYRYLVQWYNIVWGRAVA